MTVKIYVDGNFVKSLDVNWRATIADGNWETRTERIKVLDGGATKGDAYLDVEAGMYAITGPGGRGDAQKYTVSASRSGVGYGGWEPDKMYFDHTESEAFSYREDWADNNGWVDSNPTGRLVGYGDLTEYQNGASFVTEDTSYARQFWGGWIKVEVSVYFKTWNRTPTHLPVSNAVGLMYTDSGDIVLRDD